jgi:hypothetical protein
LFAFYFDGAGILDQSAVWVDEMNYYDMRTDRNKGISPLSLRPSNPLGIDIDKYGTGIRARMWRAHARGFRNVPFQKQPHAFRIYPWWSSGLASRSKSLVSQSLKTQKLFTNNVNTQQCKTTLRGRKATTTGAKLNETVSH